MTKIAKNQVLATQSTSRNGCGGAVENRNWYIAIVRHNTEKAARERLLAEGYEAYVASQTETHHYNPPAPLAGAVHTNKTKTSFAIAL